jgi:hypothetical protein
MAALRVATQAVAAIKGIARISVPMVTPKPMLATHIQASLLSAFRGTVTAVRTALGL